MSRYKITVSANLNTWADEDTVRRDFGQFVGALESVHYGIESGTASLVSVEALPESTPEPLPATDAEGLTDSAILGALQTIMARLDKAGL